MIHTPKLKTIIQSKADSGGGGILNLIFNVTSPLLKKEPRHSVGANPGSYTMIPVAGRYHQRAVLGTGWTIAMMTASVKLR